MRKFMEVRWYDIETSVCTCFRGHRGHYVQNLIPNCGKYGVIHDKMLIASLSNFQRYPDRQCSDVKRVEIHPLPARIIAVVKVCTVSASIPGVVRSPRHTGTIATTVTGSGEYRLQNRNIKEDICTQEAGIENSHHPRKLLLRLARASSFSADFAKTLDRLRFLEP